MEEDRRATHEPVFRNLSTREGYLGAIRDCGQFIVDHAEGLLGEYPGAFLSRMSISCDIDFDGGIPTVTVDRTHLALPAYDGQPGRQVN